MKVLKTHPNIAGILELVRVVTPDKSKDDPGLSEVRLPSGEIRSVDSSWLKDVPPPKPVAPISTPKDAPVPTPDAKPK